METAALQDISDVEALLAAFKTNHGKHKYANTTPLQQAFTTLDNNRDSRLEDVRADILLFDLSLHIAGERRFSETWEATNTEGEVFLYPDLDKHFPLAVLDYYASQVDATESDFHRAIYADFLWECKDWKKDKKKMLTSSVESYLHTSSVYQQEGNDFMATDGAIRAVELSLSAKDDELLKSTVPHLIKLLEHLDTQQQYRWTLDILGFLASRYKKLATYLDTSQLKQVLSNAISYARRNESERWDVERNFQKIVAELHTALGEREAAHLCRVQAAETWIEEAEWKRINYPNGNLVASGLYEKALEAFTSLGMPADRINAIKLKISETVESGKSEMTEFSTEIAVHPEQQEEIEEHIGRYAGLDIKVALRLLANDVNLRPSVEIAQQYAAKMNEATPLLRYIGIKFMAGDITVREMRGEKEHLEFRAIESIVHQTAFMAAIMLAPIMDTIVAEHCDLEAGVEAVMHESGYFGSTRVVLVRNGISAYLRGDYIAAVHVLIPQVEGAFRDMLAACRREVLCTSS